MANINRVILTGNLTADPELSTLPSGTSVCRLRLAVNRRYKDQSSGEWTEKPNYFDIKVWGAQGENCAQYLSKGRPVAIDGRLEWSEWESQDGASAPRSRSWPTPCSSSARAATAAARAAAAASARPPRSSPSRSRPSPASAASDDDIPF